MLPSQTSIDPHTKLRLRRSLSLYLYPTSELVLWTERKVFAMSPTALETLLPFCSGTSLSELFASSGGESHSPGLADVVAELAREGFLAPCDDASAHPADEAIACDPIPPASAELVAAAGGPLRLSRPLYVMLAPGGGGQLVVWVPRAQSFRLIAPATLSWLREFHRVTTAADVARVTEHALDDSERALLADLVRAGLLVPPGAGKPRIASGAPSADQAARGRIEKLVDAGSWVEDGKGAQGTLTGTALVSGRPVAIVAFTPWGDASFHALQAPIKKVLRMQENAARMECPLVYLFGDGGPSEAGPTIDTFLGKESWGRVYHNQVVLSGQVPQIGAIFGRCSMPSSFPPALCDVLVLVDKRSFLSIAPPKSVKRWLGVDVAAEELGGAKMHCTASGMGDLLAANDDEALAQIARVLSYLPSSWAHPLPVHESRAPAPGRSLEDIIPENADKPFDVLEAIRAFVDEGSLFELKRDYAKEMVTAFARLDGRTLGVVANNSRHRGGILFPESCEKEARFVSLCDAYGIPLLFLMDSPGYMIGPAVEKGGLLRATGRLYEEIVGATVSKISVVLRKAHTGGVYAMCGPFFDPDYFLALPSARIAVLGAKATYEWLAGAEKAPPRAYKEDLLAHLDARCKKEMNPQILAPQLAIDALVDFGDLRHELSSRFAHLERRAPRPRYPGMTKKHAVVQM